MEIVKRLEGSEPEEEKRSSEEPLKKEIQETQEVQEAPKEPAPKQPLLLPVLGLSAVVIVGYFGFKTFTADTSSPTTPNMLANTTNTQNTVPVEGKNETSGNNVIVHKVTEVFPKKDETQPAPKVAVYTEELAQDLKPKNEEIIKELIVTHATTTNTTETDTAVKKTPLPEIVSIQTEPEKITAKEEMSSKKTIAEKPVEKKPIVKKVVVKKPVVKKRVVKKKVIKKPKTRVAKKKRRVITVKKGDTLASIAYKYYGNAMDFKRIIRANKSIRSSKSSIKLGQKIIVPYPPKHKQRRYVTVRKGYSLAYISKKFYGTTSKIQTIVDANRDIKNKNSTLRIGQKVYVPK